MFKLHDKIRRLLTLLIFLLLGPALLFIVVTKGCARHSVRTAAGWEALLSDALGKQVEIESVRFPAPGIVRFSQMRVRDSETNGVFLQIPQWEMIEHFGEMPHSIDPSWLSQVGGEGDIVLFTGGAITESCVPFQVRSPYQRGLLASLGFAWSHWFGKQPRYLHCEIPKISCYDTAIPQVKDTLLVLAAKKPGSKVNRNQTSIDFKPMVLFVGTIDVFCTDGNPDTPTLPVWEAIDHLSRQPQMPKPDCVTIVDVCFEFRSTEEQTTFAAIFQQANQPADAKPLQLAVSRRRNPVTLTRVHFTSGDNEVPNRILTELDPFFAAFGQQSRFNGNITAEKSVNPQKNRVRSLELNQAAFSNVALDSLLSKSLTFRLDGTADKVMLDSVKLYGESNDAESLRLEHAKGRMYSARGLASWPGLRRFVQGTKLQLFPENASPPDTDISFRNGTFAFQIDAQGIQLYPAIDESQQRMPLLVIDNQCDVVIPNPGNVIRYVDLLASLAQPDTQQIPLMSETRHLISILPITTERDVTTPNVPFAQVSPINTPTQQSQPQPQLQPAWLQAEWQPAVVNREIVSRMIPVPSLPVPSPMPAASSEQYQYQPQQLAMGNGLNGSHEQDSSVLIRRPLQDDSYKPAPRPSESQFFGMQQNPFSQTTPVSPSALQPIQQQAQSSFSQLHSLQSDAVPFGNRSQQLTTANPSSNRVVISEMAGNLNRVQTDRSLVAQEPFSNERPALFDPYQQTQVASSVQTPHYDNRSVTYSSEPYSSSPFGLWGTNPQNNR